MSETKIDILAKLPLRELESLRDTYEARHDRQSVADVREAIGRKGAVQTEELARSGQLFGHRIELDPSGLGTRPAVHYTGDPLSWMKTFMSPGAIGRVDSSLCTGANSPEAKALAASQVTVTVRLGETVRVVKA